MQKKIRKIIALLMCTASMLVCAMYVSAADANHVCIKETVVKSVGGPYYQTGSPNYHHATFGMATVCKGCGGSFEYWYEQKDEMHHWTHADDLGHSGQLNHRFRLQCGKCGGTIEVTILCGYLDNGYHDTPL